MPATEVGEEAALHPTRAETEIELIVDARTMVADDVVELSLRPAHGSELPRWSAGAHIDLVLDRNEGMVRQYSLCGDPTDRKCWRVAVLLEAESRGGSLAVHRRLGTGSTVQARGPRNNFALVPADRYVFIAGGIGIAPIAPMLAQAEAAGAPWRLVYGGRRRASMAYVDALVERYGETKVDVRPEDETGMLDLDDLLPSPSTGTTVYCCGPASLLGAVDDRCRSWPPDTVHVERFDPMTLEDSSASRAFEAELAVSGQTVQVPADATVLEIVEENGVQVLSSCAEGTCGMCETTVLEGEVDHRDSLLTEKERAANDTMYICVSRARSDRLVLQL